MNLTVLLARIPVALRELWRYKYAALAVAAVVAFTVLFIGMAWPVKYETSATIYADNQNILKPLLDNKAEVSKVKDQTRVVQDMMHSPRLLREVVGDVYGITVASPEELERKVRAVRSKLGIRGLGGSHMAISYHDGNADDSYDVINSVIDRFIKGTSEEKRAESKEAFTFINKQVEQYKNQLLAAEERLKQFNSENYDGSDSVVNARIAELRSIIEEMKISIDEQLARVQVTRQQMQSEGRYSAKARKVDVYYKRLNDLQQQVDVLLLSYHENYPDVVSLRLQIEDVKAAIRDAEQGGSNATVESSSIVNPLYEELRSKLAEADIELKSSMRRLEATEGLLEEEYAKRKRVAAKQAEAAELTRDYDVTKNIYDDMLERKEAARLSMTLNVEGQGLSYKVQEPAQFPLKPSGLRLLHFFILGPLLALLAPIALIIAYLIIDPRIRFADEVTTRTSAPMLAVIPHGDAVAEPQLMPGESRLLGGILLALVSAYLLLAFANKMGIIFNG